MSVRLDGDIIRLEGECGVEEAETLVLLLQRGTSAVDISQCRIAHTAIVQALLSWRAHVTGVPDEPFIRDFVLPELHRLAEPVDHPSNRADDL